MRYPDMSYLDRSRPIFYVRDLVETWSRILRDLVEKWSRSGQDLVEKWSRFGRDFVSRFGRDLVEMW